MDGTLRKKLDPKHIEIVMSPWLFESIMSQKTTSEHRNISEFFLECSCDFTGSDVVIKFTLLDYVKLEFSLKFPICLVSSNSVGIFSCSSSLTSTCNSKALMQSFHLFSGRIKKVK